MIDWNLQQGEGDGQRETKECEEQKSQEHFKSNTRCLYLLHENLNVFVVMRKQNFFVQNYVWFSECCYMMF